MIAMQYEPLRRTYLYFQAAVYVLFSPIKFSMVSDGSIHGIQNLRVNKALQKAPFVHVKGLGLLLGAINQGFLAGKTARQLP